MADAAYVVLIPARLGSSRLPNKPLADLAGVPMVVRVAQQAQASSATDVVVAADHQSIADACEKHGIKAVLTRNDHPSGSDRLAQAAELLGLRDDQIVVNVQGDEPLINPLHIHQVAQWLADRPEVQMSTLAHPITDTADWVSPHVVKVYSTGTRWPAISAAPVCPIGEMAPPRHCHPTRFIDTWVCTLTVVGFSNNFLVCKKRPPKKPRHSSNCARFGMVTPLRCTCLTKPVRRALTPRKI